MQADAIIVGLGPGGEQVAGDLAVAGLRVVGKEAELVGGECPYWGCVPSKTMVRAAGLLADGRSIPGMAGTSVVTPDWSPVARRIREATDSWDDQVAVDRFEGKGDHFMGVLVGATSTGPTGGEVLGLLALAVHARVPLETTRSMIFAYPTFHRAVDSALWSPPSSEVKIAGA